MFHLISHELAQQASTICRTWEEILHIYKQPCIILFTLQTDNNTHDDFPKISDYFQKISEDFQTFVWRPDKCLQTFLKNFRRLSKIAKDFQGRSEDVLIIHHQIYKYSLRVWRDLSLVRIGKIQCAPAECHMRLSMNFTSGLFSSKTHNVYIIKNNTYIMYLL